MIATRIIVHIQRFSICPIGGSSAPEWGNRSQRSKVHRFAEFVSKQTRNCISPFDNPDCRR
ncbi:hypothetical protein [Citrobacter rodentium]|jgi:hypothetical protein|uniref:hypothetical protein n=1 Tax=Citrobacter rodentium TaxID=67825 RepID=UPI0003EB2227|nr:hypothetical protein [Citrobacter rodentium]